MQEMTDDILCDILRDLMGRYECEALDIHFTIEHIGADNQVIKSNGYFGFPDLYPTWIRFCDNKDSDIIFTIIPIKNINLITAKIEQPLIDSEELSDAS